MQIHNIGMTKVYQARAGLDENFRPGNWYFTGSMQVITADLDGLRIWSMKGRAQAL